jgi:phospholipid/cholesterol/gamma-HCH transport system permease protein
MSPPDKHSLPPATLTSGATGEWRLGGAWTVHGLGAVIEHALVPAGASENTPEGRAPGVATLPAAGAVTVLDGSALVAMDSAGAWSLQRALGSAAGSALPELRGWPARSLSLMQEVQASRGQTLAQPVQPSWLQHVGLRSLSGLGQGREFIVFIGQLGLAALAVARQPRRFHWRGAIREIEIGGFDALPIIGLTAFLLGVVVAYQGADQLRHYGANVFVVELVGYAMLREFAPLISAIIIAGRSGSAHAAEIGTMVVTEEIDAMRTIGIDPLERLVLPKVLALAVALPLLTVFADVAGVFGGMVMARSQLDIGFGEFLTRFGSVMQGSAFLIGVGKSFVFAFIIVVVGCFQGFRTKGSADSVGRQTTMSVVQANFLVLVFDAAFSVIFNMLDL